MFSSDSLLNRVTGYAAGLLLAVVLLPFNTTWWVEALLLGGLLFTLVFLVAPNDLSVKTGLVSMAIGAALLVSAFAVAAYYDYSLAALARDWGVFRPVHRLPSFSVGLLGFGALTLLASVLRTVRRGHTGRNVA